MHKLRRFGFNAIKESFDRLPTAVCFFDRSGGIVLCNRQMSRLSQYLLNSDMQYLEELQRATISRKNLLHIPMNSLQVRNGSDLIQKNFR